MTDPRCGTIPGYTAHRARHERPCDRCKAARALYDRQRREAPKPPPKHDAYDLAEIVIEKRPTWRNEAACAPLVATWDDAEPHDQIAVCRRCPVARQCLAYAYLHKSTHIVYGGRLLDPWPLDAKRWLRADLTMQRRGSHGPQEAA